ncbi:uncharacterized protein A4U43_C09F5080 [Asparagus officinalis]|uniref:Uncharacterized protein n=1 Tax=Asparagus officinalis TaxID=4686 RepID=A0A5P1E781_ASPOF|nr:(+)-neomenthol dehydrogenase [Asparagus officinalis]ONK57873.1 uncharacterized protein A4U43_C09F5080 [Asparagus officinalis]
MNFTLDQSNLATSSNTSQTAFRWWSKETVAVVTGANKGIGFELVRKFSQLELTVILTARDITKGKEAVDSLKAIGLKNIEVCQLDITDISSIKSFVSWLEKRFGGLDILVNNAGVCFNEINGNSIDYAETVIKTNFYGPKILTEALMPLFRRSASMSRILNISSQLGAQTQVSNPSLRELLRDEGNLSEKKIDKMICQFLSDVKMGVWQEKGWPNVWTDYSISKFAVNAYSRLLAKQNIGRNLSVNCFCPGFTRTAMTGGKGHRTAAEAAEIGSWIALLPPNELPNGEFFKIPAPSITSKL